MHNYEKHLRDIQGAFEAAGIEATLYNSGGGCMVVAVYPQDAETGYDYMALCGGNGTEDDPLGFDLYDGDECIYDYTVDGGYLPVGATPKDLVACVVLTAAFNGLMAAVYGRGEVAA